MIVNSGIYFSLFVGKTVLFFGADWAHGALACQEKARAVLTGSVEAVCQTGTKNSERQNQRLRHRHKISIVSTKPLRNDRAFFTTRRGGTPLRSLSYGSHVVSG
jgi:hypothetical protein